MRLHQDHLFKALGSLNNMETTQNKFTVTIDDNSGTGAYQYEIYLPEDVASFDVIKLIANRFSVPVPKGKYIPTNLGV